MCGIHFLVVRIHTTMKLYSVALEAEACASELVPGINSTLGRTWLLMEVVLLYLPQWEGSG